MCLFKIFNFLVLTKDLGSRGWRTCAEARSSIAWWSPCPPIAWWDPGRQRNHSGPLTMHDRAKMSMLLMNSLKELPHEIEPDKIWKSGYPKRLRALKSGRPWHSGARARRCCAQAVYSMVGARAQRTLYAFSERMICRLSCEGPQHSRAARRPRGVKSVRRFAVLPKCTTFCSTLAWLSSWHFVLF